MPEQPAWKAVQSGLGLNLRIISVVIFNFASYLTIGLPLAVLPGYAHDAMGYSAFWAGLVISLLLLCLGRIILGVGQSFAGTGATLWGVGVVGSLHTGRVISWNGIFTYGAMAIGAPLGVAIYRWGGLLLLAAFVIGIALLAMVMALPRPAVKSAKGKQLPFRAGFPSHWRGGSENRSATKSGQRAGNLHGLYGSVAGYTGPLAGLVMGYFGVPVVYLFSGLLVCIALLLTLKILRNQPLDERVA